MATERTVAPMAAALAGALLSLAIGGSAAAATTAFTISDPRITESSGLATDSVNRRYWTMNDSGSAGVAYALNNNGKVTGTINFRADPVDLEGIAFHNRRLYLADIGDNQGKRDFVTVYVFDNAEPAAGTVTYRAYDFAYSDRPHDAETLLVDGKGRMFIVTKAGNASVYAAPKNPSTQGVNKLKRVGAAPSYVTDGTVLPDGRYALRTYVSVEVVDPDSFAVVARSMTPAQRQSESITTTFSGKSLLIGSEGADSAVLKVSIPTAASASPSATPTSSPSPTVVPTPSESPSTAVSPTTASADPADADDPAADEPAESAPSQRGVGTLIAIGLAALVAAAAGATVALFRRR